MIRMGDRRTGLTMDHSSALHVSFQRRLLMSNSSPKASIIIATRSRPRLLPRAVKSAQAAGSNVEVVVVDDASTDETAEVCRGLSGITYVRAEHNQRVAGARTSEPGDRAAVAILPNFAIAHTFLS